MNDAIPNSDDTGNVHAAFTSHVDPRMWKL